MRIARFAVDGVTRLGAVTDEGVRPFAPGTDLLDLLAADPAERERAIDEAASILALSDVHLLAPLQPSTFRDFVSFEEHVEGVRKSMDEGSDVPSAWYEAPRFYFSNPYAVVGPHDDVPIPPGCQVLDFELEVAAVIGRGGADLTPAAAHDCIAGYTILNDWSARDLQRREMQVMLGPAKGKDFASTFGPWIVTADELEPLRREERLQLELEVSINDEPFGSDTLANMGWSFEEMVAFASRGTEVRPGDVLGSGTCGGGCLAEIWGRRGRMDPPPLADGDVVEMTVEGIGTLRNRVVAGVEPVAIGPARPPKRRARSW